MTLETSVFCSIVIVIMFLLLISSTLAEETSIPMHRVSAFGCLSKDILSAVADQLCSRDLHNFRLCSREIAESIELGVSLNVNSTHCHVSKHQLLSIKFKNLVNALEPHGISIDDLIQIQFTKPLSLDYNQMIHYFNSTTNTRNAAIFLGIDKSTKYPFILIKLQPLNAIRHLSGSIHCYLRNIKFMFTVLFGNATIQRLQVRDMQWIDDDCDVQIIADLLKKGASKRLSNWTEVAVSDDKVSLNKAISWVIGGIYYMSDRSRIIYAFILLLGLTVIAICIGLA